jgi:hypothetical protein
MPLTSFQTGAEAVAWRHIEAWFPTFEESALSLPCGGEGMHCTAAYFESIKGNQRGGGKAVYGDDAKRILQSGFQCASSFCFCTQLWSTDAMTLMQCASATISGPCRDQARIHWQWLRLASNLNPQRRLWKHQHHNKHHKGWTGPRLTCGFGVGSGFSRLCCKRSRRGLRAVIS